jgi:hypothetical protein
VSTATQGWAQETTPRRPAAELGHEPGAVERAILRTVAYAGLFQAPLSLDELHRALMDVSASVPQLRELLDRPYLRARVARTRGLVHLRGREDWLDLRERRRAHTRALLDRHRRALRGLGRLPFVRLVALSGACAHDNAADDDVDVFLVVAEGRAWMVWLAVVLLSRLYGLRRSLCVNYVLDEAVLALPERDRFTAAQVASLRPLAGRAAYARFVRANPWVARYHPNFQAHHASAAVPEIGAARWLECVLACGPAPVLGALSRLWLGRRLRRQARGRPGVSLSAHRLKLHTRDHGPRLMAEYGALLAALGESLPEGP